ncbi:MAG TPA: DoxX family protein [Bryobacteraceae bacterium]|nr:DoxX family protein [Bryobacteraceae bacterium]
MERLYRQLIRAASSLDSPFLLLVRLYWGWQFFEAGWSKTSHLGRVANFFATIGIPAPALSAAFISGLEIAGGILLAIGLGSRLIALLLTIDMVVALSTAHREALLSIFSNPAKFFPATPVTFLIASLIVLIFGPGKFSLDAILASRMKKIAR